MKPPWIQALARPDTWFPFIPLLCLGAAFLWAWGAAVHPGMMPGRSAGALLIVGCVLALALPTRLGWSWRSPLPWLVGALLWQGAALVGWAVVREPGIVWLTERAAALLTAIGIAAWCRGRDGERLLTALAGCGAGCLLLAATTQPPMAGNWPTGPDLPFGNPNFAVGGAVPLLGLALPFGNPVTRAVLALGVAAAALLGSGLVTGDGARAAWLGLGAMAGLWLILRLPRRTHGWFIALGEIAVVVGLALLIAGAVPLPGDSPSSHYRLALWRSAWEAIGHAPLLGSGPASAIVVLQEQAFSPVAWLWVPSYAEHAHNEYLNALIDGGVVNAGLLLAGLLLTLAPLWRRREQPVFQGLLLAWAGVLTQALVESHLSQPGPLLLLAGLAGVTWALLADADAGVGDIPDRPRNMALPLLCILVGALAFALVAREFVDGGSPTMIEVRAENRMKTAGEQNRFADSATIADGVRLRLGDLDRWLTIEAEQRARAQDFTGAERLVIDQLRRLPVDPGAVDLALRLRDRHERRKEISPELNRSLVRARDQGQALLRLVPETAKSATQRQWLARLYPRI